MRRSLTTELLSRSCIFTRLRYPVSKIERSCIILANEYGREQGYHVRVSNLNDWILLPSYYYYFSTRASYTSLYNGYISLRNAK